MPLSDNVLFLLQIKPEFCIAKWPNYIEIYWTGKRPLIHLRYYSVQKNHMTGPTYLQHKCYVAGKSITSKYKRAQNCQFFSR